MQGKFYEKKVNYQIRDILRENLEELFFLINKKTLLTHIKLFYVKLCDTSTKNVDFQFSKTNKTLVQILVLNFQKIKQYIVYKKKL